MSETKEHTILMWLDLETTGLDEKTGRILEYAAVFTDLELNELAALEGIVLQNIWKVKNLMNDFVLDMHTKNGLLEELAQAGDADYNTTLTLAEGKLLSALESLQDENTIVVIAGSTISFDRGWVKEHMPTLEETLHYRQLDVSSYKVGFPEIFGTETSEAHRAMADVRQSIAQQVKMRQIVRAREEVIDQLEKKASLYVTSDGKSGPCSDQWGWRTIAARLRETKDEIK